MAMRGFIIGKFLPFHKGHFHLINYGMNFSDELHVAVCKSRKTESYIPAHTRAAWIKECFPGASVRIIDQDYLGLDDEDSSGWAKATIEHLGFVPDAVFTSENYGDSWANHIGCKHVCVDGARKAIPISGTQIRENPWKWSVYLPEVVQEFIHSPTFKQDNIRRICVLGAESTGKSTLCKNLANGLNTLWVPEFGRTYTEMMPDPEAYEWQKEDFYRIAHIQNWHETAMCQYANQVLFCDTNSYVTHVFLEEYLGVEDHRMTDYWIDQYEDDWYSLYVLTDVNTPFEQDWTGLREDGKRRYRMHDAYLEHIQSKPHMLVSGSPHEREERVLWELVQRGWITYER